MPSGMRLTVPTDVSPAPRDRAVGYTGRNNASPAPDWKALRPSGAFFSTLGDLGRWDFALYGSRIVSEAARREMWTPVRLNDGTTYPYGYGWHAETIGGRRVVWHGGGLPGYASYMGRFVDDGVTVIVLANGNDADLISIGHGVAAEYVSRAAR
jgi:CubicO group peptidase (beta-lactamase class C family)